MRLYRTQSTPYNPEIYISNPTLTSSSPHGIYIQNNTTLPTLLQQKQTKKENDIPILPPNRRLRANPLPPHPLPNILPPPNGYKHRNPRPHRRLASLPHRPQAIPALAQRPAPSLRGRYLGRAAPPTPGDAGEGGVCKSILR